MERFGYTTTELVFSAEEELKAWDKALLECAKEPRMRARAWLNGFGTLRQVILGYLSERVAKK